MYRTPHFPISETYDPSQWVVEREETSDDGIHAIFYVNGMVVNLDLPPLTYEQEISVVKRMSEINYRILERKAAIVTTQP